MLFTLNIRISDLKQMYREIEVVAVEVLADLLEHELEDLHGDPEQEARDHGV